MYETRQTNPSRAKIQPFSQMTNEEKKMRVHDGEVEEGRGVIRSVKIDNKQIGKNIMFLQLMALQQCFFICLQSVVQFSFRSFFFFRSSVIFSMPSLRFVLVPIVNVISTTHSYGIITAAIRSLIRSHLSHTRRVNETGGIWRP